MKTQLNLPSKSLLSSIQNTIFRFTLCAFILCNTWCISSAQQVIYDTGGGGVGIDLGLTDNPTSVNTPMIRWDARNEVNKTYAMRQEGSFWRFKSYSPTSSSEWANSKSLLEFDFDGKAYFGHNVNINGTVKCKKARVTLEGFADFVFEKNYDLPTLDEVEQHINENGHLKDIPKEAEVMENGLDLGEMNVKLLQKVEELTLYVIELNKRLKAQEEIIKVLQN